MLGNVVCRILLPALTLSGHHKDIEAGLEVVGAEVAVFEVVGVLPDVDAVEQAGAFHHG